jgi:hypothetical protein
MNKRIRKKIEKREREWREIGRSLAEVWAACLIAEVTLDALARDLRGVAATLRGLA